MNAAPQKDEIDDDIDLPPLDADDDGAEAPPEDLDDELVRRLDDGGDPLDDLNAVPEHADPDGEEEIDVGPLDEGMVLDEALSAGDEHEGDHGDHDGLDLD